jgi:hypothetical protein
MGYSQVKHASLGGAREEGLECGVKVVRYTTTAVFTGGGKALSGSYFGTDFHPRRRDLATYRRIRV